MKGDVVHFTGITGARALIKIIITTTTKRQCGIILKEQKNLGCPIAAVFKFSALLRSKGRWPGKLAVNEHNNALLKTNKVHHEQEYPSGVIITSLRTLHRTTGVVACRSHPSENSPTVSKHTYTYLCKRPQSQWEYFVIIVLINKYIFFDKMIHKWKTYLDSINFKE